MRKAFRVTQLHIQSDNAFVERYAFAQAIKGAAHTGPRLTVWDGDRHRIY